MTQINANDLDKRLVFQLKQLHLPTIRNSYGTLCELAVKVDGENPFSV